jgi:hypothetical protein
MGSSTCRQQAGGKPVCEQRGKVAAWRTYVNVKILRVRHADAQSLQYRLAPTHAPMCSSAT